MNKKPVKLLLLGATGSIGTQTLDVLQAHPDDFELVGISAGKNKAALESILAQFPSVKAAGLSAQDETIREDANGVVWYGGEKQMVHMVEELDYDLLVNAVVGFRGLAPTLAAIERDKDVALANKESLVCGGELVQDALKKHDAVLRPIDSEHSAIWQCLQGNRHEDVSRLIITASGGSLRDLGREELADIIPERALKHPSWSMGPRITIDSATMVNKGFEVIEAHYLFDMPYEQIATVLHPQSIVHSIVEYQDGASIAQLGSADMCLPIQYALYGPDRPYLKEDHPLDLTRTLTLNFKEMDHDRYPMLLLAVQAGKRGGNAGCIFNAADEQAVDLFLKKKISFLEIEEAIADALEQIPFIENPDLNDLFDTDARTRAHVKARWCGQNASGPLD